jgi:regulator of protease activity HflC (stomatin/prohibitin superfamily)
MSSENKISPVKAGILVVASVALILLATLSSQVVETNQEGNYQIKQAAVSGEITVRNKAGMYGQYFGNITTYQVSDMYYFSTSNLDGGSGAESDPIKVRFNDGGTADLSGFIKFKLSTSEKNQLLIHKEYKSYRSVVSDLIRQHVASALKQTASLMKAEETYSSRRAEFIAMAEEQIVRGIFDTEPTIERVKDASGKEFIQRGVRIKVDSKGNPRIKKASPFIRYGVETLDFNIKDIDFDATIDNLIAKKKEAQQKMVVARAQAEEAKQNAITAKEKGKAAVARAKAEEEVSKIREITQMEKEKEVAELKAKKEFNVAKVQAQKDYDVAELNAKKELEVAKLDKQAADQRAKANLVTGEAEAKVAKLKVAAGLTPLERAQIEKETQIGVAEALARIKLPETFIAGGGGKNGGLDPFTAIGLESLINVKDKMSNSNKTNRK